MARTKQRISTSGGEHLSQENPFGGLSSAGLPTGPATDTGSNASVTSSAPARPPRRETLVVRRLTAGRGGKVVTEVSGFTSGTDAQSLLKRLQGRLGTGGTVSDGCLELQGECRERIKPLLEAEGFRIKGI